MPHRRSILVDARFLRASGIGRYLRAVLGGILEEPRFAEVVLLGNPRELREYLEGRRTAAEVTIVPCPTAAYSPRFQLRWLGAGSPRRADVSFFPHYDAPFFRLPPRSVVTVHDLTHFRVPDAFPAWQRGLGGLLLDRVVRGAARVLTVSHSTRRDLAERVPRSASRIEVVPNGVNPVFLVPSSATDDGAVEADRLRPFLLYVGNRKPHKNVIAVVEALALLRPGWPGLRLVLAGGQSNNAGEAIRRHADALGVAAEVVVLSDISDERLRVLYATCEAFVFPSLYEGFGLPVVEAMACGAPVVASDRASLPEVVGDAGLLVDPTEPAGIAAAVRRIRDEPGLRGALVERGRVRAAHFSEAEAARRTVEVLLEVGEG